MSGLGPCSSRCLAVMSRVSQPCVRVQVCFLGVTPAVHTSTQSDGVRSTANPSPLLKVSRWPGSAAFAAGRLPRHAPADAPAHVFGCSTVAVSGRVETRGGPKLPVQAQVLLLSCALDFMVHEEIVALLDVSQVPVCLAQTWLVLQGSRTFRDTCHLAAGASHLLHLPPSRLS